jgi:hypothetical protein
LLPITQHINSHRLRGAKMKNVIAGSLICLSLSVLAACGSGTGSTQTNPAVASAVFVNNTGARNYFPNALGNTWTFVNGNNSADRRINTVVSTSDVNSQSIMQVVFGDGTKENFLYQLSNDTVDIYQYQYLDANGQLYKTMTCNPPFPWHLLHPTVGETYSRTYNSTTTVIATNATSTSNNTKTMAIIGYETVVTPVGTFVNALKTSYLYANDTYPGYTWWVSGIGKVKETFSSSASTPNQTNYELTSYTVH